MKSRPRKVDINNYLGGRLVSVLPSPDQLRMPWKVESALKSGNDGIGKRLGGGGRSSHTQT